ncbi:MAG: prepilin-type N-terminal cleavage/methylation domain-containing protein [Rhodoferax sp.]|nr:prepilin-type N-terminal cleavage/methylation domain-containing protein [Rhodoferax sp.]
MNINHGHLGVRRHGLTLVELLVVLAISAVLLAIAIPSFSSMLYASRLRGAADILMADFRLTMTESTKRGDDILVSFQRDSDGSNWCYGLSALASCNCREANSCLINNAEHVVRGTNFAGILATPTHSNYWFKSRRSTITAGNVTFTARDGKQLKVLVSGYGRIRPCSPSGNSNISGFPICP